MYSSIPIIIHCLTCGCTVFVIREDRMIWFAMSTENICTGSWPCISEVKLSFTCPISSITPRLIATTPGDCRGDPGYFLAPRDIWYSDGSEHSPGRFLALNWTPPKFSFFVLPPTGWSEVRLDCRAASFELVGIQNLAPQRGKDVCWHGSWCNTFTSLQSLKWLALSTWAVICSDKCIQSAGRYNVQTTVCSVFIIKGFSRSLISTDINSDDRLTVVSSHLSCLKALQRCRFLLFCCFEWESLHLSLMVLKSNLFAASTFRFLVGTCQRERVYS